MPNLPYSSFDLTSNDGSYGASADITIPFIPVTYILKNTSAAAILWVSFDGVTDHLKLDPSDDSKIVIWPGNEEERNIWFRRDSADVDTAGLDLMAAGINSNCKR